MDIDEHWQNGHQSEECGCLDLFERYRSHIWLMSIVYGIGKALRVVNYRSSAILVSAT